MKHLIIFTNDTDKTTADAKVLSYLQSNVFSGDTVEFMGVGFIGEEIAENISFKHDSTSRRADKMILI